MLSLILLSYDLTVTSHHIAKWNILWNCYELTNKSMQVNSRVIVCVSVSYLSMPYIYSILSALKLNADRCDTKRYQDYEWESEGEFERTIFITLPFRNNYILGKYTLVYFWKLKKNIGVHCTESETLYLYSCVFFGRDYQLYGIPVTMWQKFANYFLDLRNIIFYFSSKYDLFYRSVVWNIVIYTNFYNGIPCAASHGVPWGKWLLQLFKMHWLGKAFSVMPFA